MGYKRKSRGRIHAIEKLGKSLTAAEIGIGAGMEPALVRATQKREGLEIMTEIVLNLGTSKAAIASFADDDVIGVDGAAANVMKWTQAVFGRLLSMEMVCFESPVTGDDDLRLYLHSAAVNANAPTAGSGTDINNGAWATGINDSHVFATDTYTASPYFHLTQQDGAPVAGTYSAGKFVLRVIGQADPENSDI